MHKIITLVALLWAFIGASAQIKSNVTLFSAKGGEKCIITTTDVQGVKDTMYTINVCISATKGGSLSSIKTITVRGNDSVKTIIDTTTDANSNGGIPSALWYVKVKMFANGIVDTVSNEIGPIEVTDSIKKPTVTLVGKPFVDSLGNVYTYAKVTSNGPAILRWFAAYDSTKVYREQNRINDSISIVANTTNATVLLFFGNIPLNKMIYCGVLIKNKAGKDSVTASKSDIYMPKQAPSCDLDSVFRYSDRFKVRLRVVGYKMQTTSGFNFRKLGTTKWLPSIDSAVITGDSIQFPILNSPSILEPESGYEIQGWSRNLLGTTYSTIQIWYTTKASNPGFFSIRVTKAVAGVRKDLDLNFTVTVPNGGNAVVTPKISEFSDFRTATLLPSYSITSSTENRFEHINLPTYVTVGRYYVTMQGMDSKGTVINTSDVLTIDVRNWALGIDPNGQFINSDMSGATFMLYDLNGTLVKSEVVQENQKICLSDVKKGTYIYTISMESKITKGKIIKN